MEYEEVASLAAAAPAAVEPDSQPPAAEPEVEAAHALPEPVAGAGPVDGALALQLFGHYAEGSTAPDAAQSIGSAPDDPGRMAPPAPGVTCNQGKVLQQYGADAYSTEGLQDGDKEAALKDPTFKADPAAAMQRARAHRELADKFEIVDAGYSGPRNSNTLTQAEYDRTCETYSNIRMGKGDLTIDTNEMCPEDALAYRDGMMKDLGTMMQTETGRKEIQQLSNNKKVTSGGIMGDIARALCLSDGTEVEHRHTTLRRRHQDNNGDGDMDNDDDQPLSRTNASTHAFSPDDEDKQFRQKDGSAGEGADQVIRFNPGINLPLNIRDDVALAHEMAHAIQGSQGIKDPDKVGAELGPPNSGDPLAGDRGERRSEHQATGLGRYANNPLTENAYRRERHKLGQNVAKGALPSDVDIEHRDNYRAVETTRYPE